MGQRRRRERKVLGSPKRPLKEPQPNPLQPLPASHIPSSPFPPSSPPPSTHKVVSPSALDLSTRTEFPSMDQSALPPLPPSMDSEPHACDVACMLEQLVLSRMASIRRLESAATDGIVECKSSRHSHGRSGVSGTKPWKIEGGWVLSHHPSRTNLIDLILTSRAVGLWQSN